MNTPSDLTFEARVELTRVIFRTLDDWQVPRDSQPALLGLDPALRPRKVNRYRLGQPLPQEGETYHRVLLLLQIDNAVQKLFPHSTLSANLWITTPRVKLGGVTPLELMLKHGLEGMRSVERGLYNLDLW